jgi:Tfp pilus assembly PilM family ATPase
MAEEAFKPGMAAIVSRWWDRLEGLLPTETDTIGAYVDKSGLTLARVSKNRGKFQVRDVALLSLAGGGPENLAPKLRDQIAKWGLEGSPVNLAVNSWLAFVRQVTLPRAAAENLAQVVGYELDRYVPVPSDQVYFGYQVQEITDAGLNLIIMAVAKDRVAAWLSLLGEAGLRPIGLTLAPLAAANAFAILAGRRLPNSWLMLHIDAGAIELTQIHKGVVKKFQQARGIEGLGFLPELQAGIDNLEAQGVGGAWWGP